MLVELEGIAVAIESNNHHKYQKHLERLRKYQHDLPENESELLEKWMDQ